VPYSRILNRILNSDDYGVGGGSAAAMACGMAAALVAMVAKLSVKKDYGLSQAQLANIASEAEELSKVLLAGAEQDAEAFQGIKDAFSLPKGKEEEQARRNSAIQKGFATAALVPKNNAWHCHKVQELCALLVGKSNPACSSDLGVACYLADVALLGCVLNIEANVESITDDETKMRFEEQAALLRGHVKLLKIDQWGN